MKVWIDTPACVGNGICAELAETVFAFDGEYAYVIEGDRVRTDVGAVVEVPPDCEGDVVEAAAECPAACIHVETS